MVVSRSRQTLTSCQKLYNITTLIISPSKSGQTITSCQQLYNDLKVQQKTLTSDILDFQKLYNTTPLIITSLQDLDKH